MPTFLFSFQGQGGVNGNGDLQGASRSVIDNHDGHRSILWRFFSISGLIFVKYWFCGEIADPTVFSVNPEVVFSKVILSKNDDFTCVFKGS